MQTENIYEKKNIVYTCVVCVFGFVVSSMIVGFQRIAKSNAATVEVEKYNVISNFFNIFFHRVICFDFYFSYTLSSSFDFRIGVLQCS